MEKTIVIKGREIYSRVRVVSANPLMDTSSSADREPQPYWIATIDGLSGILREDVVSAIKNGECSELSYGVNTRNKLDDQGNETDETVDNFSYSGHSTYKQLINVAKNEALLTKIAASVELPEDLAELLAAETKTKTKTGESVAE
jgi:hypothetical protein